MSASVRCHHPGLSFGVEPIEVKDNPGVVFVKLDVRCPDCGARFRFIGLDAGAAHPDAPTVNAKATQVMFPMEAIR